MVQPAFSAIAYVTHARSLDWDVVVASYEDEGRRVAESVRSAATEMITADTNSGDVLEAAVVRSHQRNAIHAVVAGGEYYVPAAARLSARLGLSGLVGAAVDQVRHKARMLEAVAAAGLEVPRFTVVRELAELDAACAEIGFPAGHQAGRFRRECSCVARRLSRRGAGRCLRFTPRRGVSSTGRSTADVMVEQYVAGTGSTAPTAMPATARSPLWR